MNILPVTILSITSSAHLSTIEAKCHNDRFVFLMAESVPSLRPNELEQIAFKETEVILALSNDILISSNMCRAILKDIQMGIVLTSVSLDYHGNTIVSLIPTHTFKQLPLSVGDEVLWIIQPSEISLLRSHNGE